MDHRLTRLLFLAALMVWVQLGGMMHGVGHHPGDDQDEPHAACELCAAYAAFGNGIPSLPLLLALAAKPLVRVARMAQPATVRVRLHFHSRAPPVRT